MVVRFGWSRTGRERLNLMFVRPQGGRHLCRGCFQIMDLYRTRIATYSQAGAGATSARQNEAIQKKMRLSGIKAEHAAIFRLLRRRQIGSETTGKHVRELDLLEAR
jgi:hypothetical protein